MKRMWIRKQVEKEEEEGVDWKRLLCSRDDYSLSSSVIDLSELHKAVLIYQGIVDDGKYCGEKNVMDKDKIIRIIREKN